MRGRATADGLLGGGVGYKNQNDYSTDMLLPSYTFGPEARPEKARALVCVHFILVAILIAAEPELIIYAHGKEVVN